MTKRTSKKLRLTVHVLLSTIILSILGTGCFLLFKTIKSLRILEDEPSEEENMMMHVNFTISLMVWFRFIESFLCTSMYASSAVAACRRSICP
jgi:hypothetical protein